MLGLLGSLTMNVPTLELKFTNFSGGSLTPSADLTGTPAQITTQIQSLAFLPPTPVYATCDINRNNCTPAASFNDTLSSGGTDKGPAAVTVNIQALTAYNTASTRQPTLLTVFGILSQPGGAGTSNPGTSCSNSTCHGSSTGTGAGIWLWTGTAASTYTNFKYLVVAGDPASSLFYTAPCQGSDAAMGNVFAESSLQCQIIYQWILEGGLQN